MSRYVDCLNYILKWEGGYVNDPKDRGGATNKGITQKTYNAYLNKLQLPLQSVEYITDIEVEEIYIEDYWNKCHCFDILNPLDLIVFDSAVQHGVSRASKWLQNCVGVTPDGVIGEKTLYALHGKVLDKRLADVIDNYINGRISFYAQIIANDPSQKRFAKGWKNRMDALALAIK